MKLKNRPIASSFAVVLFLITLCFGGMHPAALSATLAALFFLTGASLLFSTIRIRALGKQYAVFISVACLLIGYVALQPILLVNAGHPQPYYSTYDRIQLPVFLGIVSFLTALLLSSKTISLASLHRAFIFMGVAISTIALVHWLGDNGKLFFVLEPEHLVITNRARWPFVNPNHLACFLLIPTALGLFSLEKETQEILLVLQDEMSKKQFQFVHFIGTPTGQQCCARLTRSLLPVIVMSLALIASQSRNGLFCFALLLLFLSVRSLFGNTLLDTQKKHSESVKNDIVDMHDLKLGELQNERMKGKRKFHPARLLPLVLLISLSLLLFVFSPDASDILSERFTYSVSKTGDDARFVLYRESAQLLSRSPLLGIGGQNWQHIFPSLLRSPLPGIQPRYLHSDPYQFFLEYGLIGSALCILLLGLTFRTVRRCSTSLSGLDKVGLSYAVTALLLIVVFSLFDFPFHIPAVAAGFVILLTSLYFYRSDLT